MTQGLRVARLYVWEADIEGRRWIQVADRKVLRVTLRYTDINSLFDKPDVSPFSEDFHEYSTVAGIEHIYGELQANPSLKRVETTILLPPRADHAAPRGADSGSCATLLSRPRSGGGAERASAQVEGAARARDRARTLRRVCIGAVEVTGQRASSSQIRNRRTGHPDLGRPLVSARCPILRPAIIRHQLRQLQARLADATEDRARPRWT